MGEAMITTREGGRLELDCPPGSSLMHLLRGASVGIAGTCGGMSSCGSCHVYLVAGGAALPPPGEDEADMLEGMADVVEVRAGSRLSCQIDGGAFGRLELEIAPQF